MSTLAEYAPCYTGPERGDGVKNRTLFFGDNLKILREKFPSDEGYFDLIYLDPPFNSKATYNVLFKEGVVDSPAQLSAFEDTWHWTPETQEQFTELATDPRYPTKLADAMQGMEKVLGHNDVLAYLTMMAVRLVELKRVLKESGSIYLHCDSTASHYLKVVMDAIFGPKSFRNEIIWKRRYGSSSAVHKSRKFGAVTDTILFYVASESAAFNVQYSFDDEKYQEYVKKTFRFVDEQGRRYRIADLANPAPRPNLMYEYKGYKPPANGWAISKEKMEQWDQEGRLHFPKSLNGRIQRRRFLDELKGKPVQSLWDDIDMIASQADERLHYQTQKPEALLERIIKASTNEGDWVLDPFGGCGTTAAAAEKLGRQWVIIDVTTLAINLVKRRIEKMYPDKQLDMTVDGYPADLAGAKELFARDPFEFEYWCCDLVNARPAGDKTKGKMKGADRGIDGVITFIDVQGTKQEYRKLLVQVKGGHLSAPHMRDFVGTIQREKAQGGVFISLEPPTKPMMKEAVEAGTFTYALTGQKYPVVQLLTVEELLAGERPAVPNLVGYAKAAPAKDSTEQNNLF
ncbi:MAG TPA: DNA methyltransferase [Thermoanaerobaculia bacterium]|nr:DNA methyltransferase [Thermoanaerobaculia bacterium]